jgi:UDP-N-acetylmuramoyl-L-alanyl-D-glutamate--2,6-diaminopimelate ligase
LNRGAAAIVHSQDLPSYRKSTVYIQVKDTRAALSGIAGAFYDFPSRFMTVIGVTGTDGKSTTVWFIQQLLETLGKKSGFISTVWINSGTGLRKNPFRQSTPEAAEIQGFLAEMRKNDCDYSVVEATSHGLSAQSRRLADVAFDVGVFTNVTHEHLEFHGNLEQYRNDKANLFRMLGKTVKDPADRGGQAPDGKPLSKSISFGVVNRDDPYYRLFMEAGKQPVYTYSLEYPEADLFRIMLPGLYNAANAAAAVLTVSRLLSLPLSRIAPLVARLKGVKGRYKELDQGQPFRVIVDYAHTPGAFDKLLPMIKSQTRGRLITVFGSAGERDRQKRPLQGRIASQHADIVILTDEDPRLEDRMSILEDIAGGCANSVREKNLFLEPDRRKAIRKALKMARGGDTVLCLGKGHETSIIYPDGPMDWDEVAVTEQLLEEVMLK